MGQRILVAERNMAPEMLESSISEMTDIESAFRKQVLRSEERGGDVLSQSEFELWEDDFIKNWNEHEKQLRLLSKDGYIRPEDAAKSENPLILTSHKDVGRTVEVYAGHYYQERSASLLESAQNEEQEKTARAALKDFANNISRHLEYKYTIMRGMDDAEAVRHYKDRERAHNDAISSLNRLNGLAKQYGVRGFTARNFWTSEGNQNNPYVHQRMSCDRDLLEDYAAIAFREEYRKAHKKWEENRNLF